MGLFNNKAKQEKKQRELNEVTKQQNLNLIQTIKIVSKDATVSAILTKISTELSSQPESSKSDAGLADKYINELLEEAHSLVLKGQYPIATTKLNTALLKAIDRHQYCDIGGRISKDEQKKLDAANKAFEKVGKVEKSRAEELQDKIDEMQTDVDGKLREYALLQEQYKATPNNASIVMNLKTLASVIQGLRTNINNYSIELEREKKAELVTGIRDTNEALTNQRTVNDSDLDQAMVDIQAQNTIRQENMNKNAQMDAVLNQNGMFGANFDPLADLNNFNMGVGQQTVAFDPLATPGQAAQTNYGGFDPSQIGTVDMANDLRKTREAIDKSINEYTEKIEDANDELTDLNVELKQLLVKRQNATPAECLVLDGKIDKLNSDRGNYIYKIRRYRQVVATMQDKLALLDQLDTQQDLTATNLKINQLTGGKFTDFAGLSMFLNDSVRKSNEELEEIGIANSVANQDDINMNSASASTANILDNTVTKDENKYANLEKELGIPQKQTF